MTADTEWTDEVRACLRFFSRLPLSEPASDAKFPGALRMAPVAGALLGLAAALPFLLALRFGEPPLVAAFLGVGAGVALTGALHEDGLADVADGFGGGATPGTKLAIMRDSRIGAYGAAALMLSLGLRAAALAALAATPVLAMLVMVAAGAISRCACLAPVVLLPPARADGAGQSASLLTRDEAKPAFLLALAFAFLPALGGASLGDGFKAALLAGLLVWGLCRLARRQIGGQTGDVAGAAQQAAEIAVLLVFAGAAP